MLFTVAAQYCNYSIKPALYVFMEVIITSRPFSTYTQIWKILNNSSPPYAHIKQAPYKNEYVYSTNVSICKTNRFKHLSNKSSRPIFWGSVICCQFFFPSNYTADQSKINSRDLDLNLP